MQMRSLLISLHREAQQGKGELISKAKLDLSVHAHLPDLSLVETQVSRKHVYSIFTWIFVPVSC